MRSVRWADISRWFPAPWRTGWSPEGEGMATSYAHSWPWPPWTTLLGMALAAALLLALYLREQGEASRARRWVLASLRVALVAIAVFMMYGWTKQYYRTDLPDLAVVLDDSESMAVVDHYEDEADRRAHQRRAAAAGLEPATRFNLAKSLLAGEGRGWLDGLAASYRMKLYLVGPSTRYQAGGVARLRQVVREAQPTGTASLLGKGILDVLDAQRGRPTAALLMLTDGVTTEGQTIRDAAESARRKTVPLFLVGLGSDRPPRDVRLSDLLVDEAVFVDEMVNFDAQVHCDGYGGRPAVLRLRRADRKETLAEQRITLPAGGVPQTVRLAYRPQEEGDFEHVVEVLPLPGEWNTENNRLSRRVLVRDATLRVLFVQAYPSYEFRFLQDLLSRAVRRAGEGGRAKAVELATVLQEADLEHAQQDATAQRVFPVRREDLFQYDVLIFGDVDPALLGRSAMEHISEFVTQRGGGIVFLAGERFTPLAYRNTPLAPLMPLELTTAAVPSAEEVLGDPFVVQPTPLGLSCPPLQIGDTPEETANVWRQLPGLYWLLAAPDVRPAARILAVHPARRGSRGAPLPVILLQFVGAGKVVFHATDETYRWSRLPGDPKYYARYWLQTLRYLSRAKLASGGQPAEITTDRQEYRRGETVRLRVRFLDERQAPPEDDAVVLIVEHHGGRKHQVVLRRDPTRQETFTGAVSDLPEGQYRAWLAGAAQQASPRHFTIAAPLGERARIAMDSADLREAARISRGRFYSLREADRLPQDLPPGRRVTIDSLPPRPIWNSPLVVGTFVLLITLEWLLRKRSGMV